MDDDDDDDEGRIERWSVGGGDGNDGIPRPFCPLPPPLTTRPNPYQSSNLPPALRLPPSGLPHRRRCPRPTRPAPRLATPLPRRAVIPSLLPPRSPPVPPYPRRATAPRVTLIPRDPFDEPASTWDARRGCEVADNAEIPPRRGSWLSVSQPSTYEFVLSQFFSSRVAPKFTILNVRLPRANDVLCETPNT